MKLRILLIILLFFSVRTIAQISESIRAGRPGQAIGPYNVFNKIFQCQQGYEFSRVSSPVFSKTRNYNANTIRYGISNRLEINSSIDHGFETKHLPTPPSITGYGILGFLVGTRINLIREQKQLLPVIGLQTSVHLPVDNSVHSNEFGISARLVTLHEFNQKLAIILNNQWSYYQSSALLQWDYFVNLGYAVNKKTSVFIEYYGALENHSFTNNFDGGIAYLLNDNIQLDLYSGGGKNDETITFFISAGVSYRLNLKKRL